MKTYEATGKNYEEALQNGLNALHATMNCIENCIRDIHWLVAHFKRIKETIYISPIN